MKRRDFLTKLGGGVLASGLAGASSTALFTRSAHAATGKTLVVIFQRGGNDGLNTVVPYLDDDYYRLRPRLAIAPPGAGSDAALNLDGFYGLHPALKELTTLFHEGRVAIFPAVQYPRATRSHFLGQSIIETGSPDLATNGWLARHLTSMPLDVELRAASFGQTLAESLRGAGPVPSFTSLDDISLSVAPTEADKTVNQLSKVYAKRKDWRRWRTMMLNAGEALWRNYDTVSGLDPASSSGSGSIEYPQSRLGQQLRDIARLIKSNVPLEVATVDSGNWDTHIEQGGVEGHHASLLANLSASISSFRDELGPRMRDIVVVVMTEFGRTARENANRGTDHGHASAWFAIGDSINGGIYDGVSGWPGLAAEDLHLERYLAHKVDYRNILAEILGQHLGNPQVSTLFPNFTVEPVGFV